MIVATQLRGLATAIWLAVGIEPGLGIRLAMRVLSGALTTDLGLLVVGGLGGVRVRRAAAEPRARVRSGVRRGAAAPLRRASGRASRPRPPARLLPPAVRWLIVRARRGLDGRAARAFAIGSRGWRRAACRRCRLLRGTRARRAGLAVAIAAAVGIAAQAVWIAGNLDLIEPMRHGREAPGFALPGSRRAASSGRPSRSRSTRGKITVLDFWAIWCKPCLASMPRLEQLARAHPDVAVLAINTRRSRRGARAVRLRAATR